MTDWIEHDGGPQPVADDVWVERPNSSRRIGPAHWFDWDECQYRVLNQHLIEAARLEGIRQGLEAAAEITDHDWPDPNSAIRLLDPEEIARKAKPPA